MKMREQYRGFSLLELMIVVAIIAILVAIAYPSYEQYVMRATRTEAKNALFRIAAEQEKFFSTFNRYSSSISGARTTDPAASGLNMRASSQDLIAGAPDPADQAYYTFTLALTNGNLGYVLTATPTGTQQSRDRCATMTLDNVGNKTAAFDDCW